MKKFLIFSLLYFIPYISSAKKNRLVVAPMAEFIKVEANPQKGFNYPFFLYLPADKNLNRRLMVISNNTGSSNQTYEEQSRETKRKTLIDATLAERTHSILLVPIFPRPNVDPPLYTHALSRSVLKLSSGDLKRIDLQLISMIESSRVLLKNKYKIKVAKKILMSGFSASASFAVRFSFLHPEVIEKVSIGAPGGWPIIPLAEYKNKKLNYPVGVADYFELTSTHFDLASLKYIEFNFFIGEKDLNDSVTFRDSFSEENEKLIFEMFGKTPVERWPFIEKIYHEAGLNANFKIYPDIGHEVTSEIREDVISFFNQN